jgi:hypothetical protein
MLCFQKKSANPCHRSINKTKQNKNQGISSRNKAPSTCFSEHKFNGAQFCRMSLLGARLCWGKGGKEEGNLGAQGTAEASFSCVLWGFAVQCHRRQKDNPFEGGGKGVEGDKRGKVLLEQNQFSKSVLGNLSLHLI